MKNIILTFFAIVSLLSATMAQTASVKVSCQRQFSKYVVYQALDEYSFIDSSATDSTNIVTINFDIKDTIQFARLIINNQRLPLILRKNDNLEIVVDTINILNSQISNSIETKYLCDGISTYKNGGKEKLLQLMRKNVSMVGNLFLVSMLNVSESYDRKLMVKIVEALDWCNIPALNDLKLRIENYKNMLKIGDEIPDISIPNITTGEFVNLRSCCRNNEKCNIIIFSAWDHSVDFLKLYAKNLNNPDSPSKIVAISMDGDKALTLNALTDISKNYGDKIVVLSFLNYFDNDVARIFQIKQMPLLIETVNGKISEIGIIKN